jgi:tetratricopeptide (TPR) repeat protein/DNA-binding MarR family transcriptional regulator
VHDLTLQDPSSIPIVGRETEKRTLVESLRSAKKGQRTTWLVRGPLGIGKTRLLDWLADEAEREGFRIRRGSGMKGVSTPFGVFQQSFRGSPMGALASVGEPTMTVMLHYLSLLEREAAASPVAILLDDLQSADDDSVRLFQFLARNTKGLRVLLVATIETVGPLPPAEGTTKEAGEVLVSMESEGLLSPIRIQGLRREDLRLLAESLAATQFLPGPTTDELFDVLERAGGNPYHVVATLRGLAERRQLRRNRDGATLVPTSIIRGPTGQLGLPTDARLAVERRLELLAEVDLRFLQAAATLGPDFRLEPVAAVIGKDAVEVLDLAKRLTAGQAFLVRPTAPDETWSFAHPITWHAVMESWGPAERAAMAGRFADWWSAHRPEEVEVVAQLYYLANDRNNGLTWAAKSLDHALERGPIETVERSFRWMGALSADLPMERRVATGLDVFDHLVALKGISPTALRILESLRLSEGLPPPLQTEIESRRALAICQLRGPKAAEEILVAEEAIAKTHTMTPRARTRMKLARGTIAFYNGQLVVASRAIQVVRTEARSTHMPAVRCYALYLLGLSLIGNDRLAEARGVLAELETVATEARRTHPRIELYPLGLTAVIAERQGDVLESIRAFTAVQAVAWESDDLTNVAVTLANLAAAYDDALVFDKALETARESATLARRFGLAQAEALAWAAMGQALAHLGAHEEGTRLLARAAKYFRDNHWIPRELECQIAIAGSHLASGRPQGALDLLETLAHQLSDLQPRPRILFHACRAAAYRSLRSEPRALADLKAGIKISETSGDLLGRAILKAERARLERDQGRPDKAEVAWQEARSLYRQCGIAVPLAELDPGPRSLPTPYGGPLVRSSEENEGTRPTTKGVPNRRMVDESLPSAPTPLVDNSEPTYPALLSLSQKVVSHIAHQPRVRENELSPGSLTQAGMSRDLNRPQGVVAKVLHRLESAGLTRVEVRHVRGGSRRVKVYQLTPQGEALANELRGRPDPSRARLTSPG